MGILIDCSCCHKKTKKITNVTIEATTANEKERNSKVLYTTSYPQTQSVLASVNDKKSDEENLEKEYKIVNCNQQIIKYSKNGLNMMSEIGDEEILLKEDSIFINDYEKGKIVFTKKGLSEYFEIIKKRPFNKYYDKDKLQIYLNESGTDFNNKLTLIKTIYKEKKESYGKNGDCQRIMDFMYDLNYRLQWDNQFRRIKIFEGDNHCIIIQSWALSPIFFVSERDSIEKRFIYKYNDKFYCISSSIDENVYIFI